MKQISMLFLQVIIVLIGILALLFLIRFPLMEGRATNLDLVSIYSDPFVLYAYVASIAFFVGLYKTFRLVGYIGRGNCFSSDAVKAVRGIKYCAIIVAVFIVAAGIYIKIFHSKEDDPVGFLALCMLATVVAVVVAVAAAVFEKRFKAST